MTTNRCWDGFKVGDTMRTAGVTVTETHIVNFACLTGDWYPLHVDEEFASKTIFGGRIAHGILGFSLAVGLVTMSGILGNSVIAFLGAEKLRFPAPVRPGDTVHVEVEVIDKRETEKADRGVTVLMYEGKNQKDETVMTVEMSLLMRRQITS